MAAQATAVRSQGFFATWGAAAPGGPDVCVMRLFAIALAGEQCACICTAAGWFLGRREARGDRFCKDNLGCIGLGVQAMHSGVQRRAAPIGFMRWSSPEAPILQFVVLHALEKRESSFASQMRVSSLVCLCLFF